MFSRILVKLIDQAVVPAILLLLTRVASMLLFAEFFDVKLTIDSSGFVFNSEAEYVLINSYSILSMVLIVSAGLIYILSKSFIFHDSHITPQLTAKLFSLRLSSLIQTSFDIYSQGTVWLSYLYLLFFVAAALSFFGLIYTWVFLVSLVMAISITILLIFDIENEIGLEAGSDDSLELDEIEEFVLTIGGDDE